MEIVVPCSVKVEDTPGVFRAKLNVDPGLTGPQFVILRLDAASAGELTPGKRYRVSIVEEADEAAAE